MKKIIYLVLWGLLGLIFSFIIHAIIELVYLKYAKPDSIHWVKVFNGSCALPLWLIYLLPILFIILGLWAGIFFYKNIYIKR
jgi:hypothetical protein